jgi:hypothetical protein
MMPECTLIPNLKNAALTYEFFSRYIKPECVTGRDPSRLAGLYRWNCP